MATTNVLFRRLFIRPPSLGNFGFSTREFAEYLTLGLSRDILPELYDFTHTKRGCAVYDFRNGGTLFSVDISLEQTTGDARFEVVDGSVRVPKGVILAAKRAIKSRHAPVSRKSYHYFRQTH